MSGHLIDFPAILISAMSILLLIVLGEALRAFSVGELFTPRQPRRLLNFDPIVLFAEAILFLAYIAASIAFGAPHEGESSEQVISRGLHIQTIGNLLVVAILIPLLQVTGKNRLTDYGIRWQGWVDELHYGTLGYLVSLPPVVAVMLLMRSFRGPETEHPYLKLLTHTHNDPLLVEIVFASAVTAPLMEELVFRVVLQGMLESVVHRVAAIAIPVVLFVSVHEITDALPLVPLAIVLGIVYHIRRSYVAVVTAHALFNMTFLTLTLWYRLTM
jgi:uncharacterized protein